MVGTTPEMKKETQMEIEKLALWPWLLLCFVYRAGRVMGVETGKDKAEKRLGEQTKA